MEEQIYLKILGIVLPIAIGAIGYFLKRTMNSHDKHTEQIIDIEKDYVKKSELEVKQKELKCEIENTVSSQIQPIKEDIKQVKKIADKNSTDTMNAINDLKEETKKVQLGYINKEEFFTTTTKLSNQMDKLTDMIIEIKTSSK